MKHMQKLMRYQREDLGFCTEDTGWPLRTQSNAKLKSLIKLSNNMVINFKQLQCECMD